MTNAYCYCIHCCQAKELPFISIPPGNAHRSCYTAHELAMQVIPGATQADTVLLADAEQRKRTGWQTQRRRERAAAQRSPGRPTAPVAAAAAWPPRPLARLRIKNTSEASYITLIPDAPMGKSTVFRKYLCLPVNVDHIVMDLCKRPRSGSDFDFEICLQP